MSVTIPEMAEALVLRPPRREERAVVADLVLQSDCGTLPALFGPRVHELLEHLAARNGNPYSAENTLVAASATDAVAGAAVGARVSVTRVSGLRTAAQLARWYGPCVAARLPRLARAGRSLAGLAPDDFYLAHIAVLPERRGFGVGARLLRAVEERARSAGARRVALDVDEHNTRARLFYARAGYRQESVVRIDLGRHGTFTLRRLVREV